MRIEQFIENQPLIVKPDTLLSDATTLMNQRQQANLADCVLVVSAEKLQGIVTKGDVIRSIATGVDLASTTVNKIMTQPVITLEQKHCSNIQLVWSFLQQNSCNYLPILDDRKAVIGILTTQNLSKFWHAANNRARSKYRSLKEDNRLQSQTTTKLKLFFDLNPSMFCIAGFDGYFKRINYSFTDILGFTKTELLAKPFINFVHPEDRTATIAELEKLAAGNITISFENRYQTKNGDYLWLLWTAKPNLPEQTIYAAAQDITERKKTELALKESEERWQLALRGANDGIWDWNVKTNEVFFSRRWKEMLGFGEDEIENTLEEWLKRVHSDDLDWVMKTIRDHFAKKTPFYIAEHRMLCKDGSYKWILDRGQALWDNEGNAIRMTGSHTDISDRKKAEIELQQERNFSKTTIDTVGALVAVFNRQGKIISFNRTCEQVTGYSFTEIQNRHIWDFLIIPEEKSPVKAVFERLLTGQVPNQYENYWLAKDGTRHLISWSNTALFDSQGIVEFIIATGIEITEQRRVWNQLEHQYRQTKLLAEITRKIRMSIDIKEILQTTVTEVQHLLSCDRVLIIELKANNIALPISESILPELPSMLGYELRDPLLIGKYSIRYHQGKIVAINDLATASIEVEVKQLLEQFQIKAKLVVPILSHNKLQGLLVAHQCYNSRKWQENEIQLLTQLADQIGVALSQAQLLGNLEELVTERTTELTTTNQLLQIEIAERQRTETALRENQQKLTGILDNADEAIISINERQLIQLFNRGAEKIFGYKAPEIIGQPLDILLPKAFCQIHRQHVNRFGESEVNSRTMAERSNDVFGLRKNGQEFPAEASIAKLKTREGLLFTVMLKDITERQQAEKKLQASQSLLAKAEKIAKIGSWEYDLVTQKLSWSEELFEILGFTKNEIIPSCEAVLERIHPEDCLLVKNELQQGHTKGKPWYLNYRWLLPNGTVKHLESRGEPTVDNQGRVLKVWGTVMDISQRVQTELSLQRSEQQLKLITDALPILIAYIDNQQYYRYNNRTYETWFGKPCSALLGLQIQELVGEDNYQGMLPYIETVLTGKAVTFENQIVDKHGNFYWISTTYIPDFDANGEVKGFFSMIDDISNRKEIEKMKSEFISVASHEMRTPLTSIHGVIQLLCGGRLGELSPSGKKMVKIAARNSDRLVRLVNDILDLERMESRIDKIDKTWSNSADLMQQAIDTLQSMAQEQQITIQSNPQALKLYCDRDRLVQTLTNLISNAIKFSQAHSTIEISCQQQDRDILFFVKDRGRGIPQNKLETIFERFQQVDASDSREKGGTGLGLAICRHIIEQHNGKIWVESIYGQGSTFFFTIPIDFSD